MHPGEAELKRLTARPLRAVLFGVAVVVIALDQVTKVWAVAALQDEPVRVIECCLHWTLHRNPGSAFGLFARFPVVFTVLAFTISIAIVVLSRHATSRLNALTLGLVLGGAVGNLIDRVVRSPAPFRGHVVDFIDIRVWPVFNIADSAIVVGALAMIVASWKDDRVRRDD